MSDLATYPREALHSPTSALVGETRLVPLGVTLIVITRVDYRNRGLGLNEIFNKGGISALSISY